MRCVRQRTYFDICKCNVLPLTSGAGQKMTLPWKERQWYLVRIDATKPPTIRASNNAFRSVLLQAHLGGANSKGCQVYRTGDDNIGHSYFFSREAAQHYEELIKLWGGVGVPEPTNLQNMERVISLTTLCPDGPIPQGQPTRTVFVHTDELRGS